MSIINIGGNIGSLKESVLDEIEGLYDLDLSDNELVPSELAARLAYLTEKINREIAVYINRKGNIVDISIGDSGTVSLPEVDGRKSKARLSGIRCIHTHPNGDGQLSAVDISSLIHLRLDAMVALGVSDGELTEVFAAIPARDHKGEFGKADIYGPFSIGDHQLNALMEAVLERDKTIGDVLYINETDAERAILVGLETFSGRMINGKSEGERSLDELEELAATAGCVVLEKILQKKPVKDPAYYIGKGKTEQIGLLRQALNADVLIFDVELSGAQVRNIEEMVGAKVIDRTTLILDIFAQRARSKEGKLQVELAQLKYRLPRLIGLGGQLSRLGGGIGTRGPGEKKLEVDRRHIRRRVNFLENELKQLSVRRAYTREGRKNNRVPSVALVGYTNVGKSTLMNKLCRTDVFAENKLFATLDPTTRKLVLPDGRETLLIDTVGFIRRLPHELIEAFKSTLEEAVYADVLLHVADISSEEAEEQVTVVNGILNDLEALNKSLILVLNKIDRLNDKDNKPHLRLEQRALEVSAHTGEGLDTLLQAISDAIPVSEEEVEVLAPYNIGWIVPYIYESGKVLEQNYIEDGVRIKAIIQKSKKEKIKEYIQ